MSDDIVTRLRTTCGGRELEIEAAEEIERLRNELCHLQRKIEHGCAGFYCENCDHWQSNGSEVSDE